MAAMATSGLRYHAFLPSLPSSFLLSFLLSFWIFQIFSNKHVWVVAFSEMSAGFSGCHWVDVQTLKPLLVPALAHVLQGPGVTCCSGSAVDENALKIRPGPYCPSDPGKLSYPMTLRCLVYEIRNLILPVCQPCGQTREWCVVKRGQMRR